MRWCVVVPFEVLAQYQNEDHCDYTQVNQIQNSSVFGDRVCNVVNKEVNAEVNEQQEEKDPKVVMWVQ